MKKFTRGIKGSISLFLSMIILLLVILEGFLIDGSKVLAAKTMMSSAGDLALNAGLTYYDEALRDIYGLFATCKTEEELKDNLIKHFQTTLGDATDATGDDGYTQQLLDYVKRSLTTGWNDEEAGKLLDLTLDKSAFHAAGVKGSELSQNYVIKNQILEYMKYRAPASLGYGMLEKIYAFKELGKQQKVMEKKLTHEKNMSKVQKACENAYEKIVPYNTLLDNEMSPQSLELCGNDINENIWKTIVATWCYSAVMRESGIDKEWQKKTSTTEHDVPRAILDCQLKEEMSGLYSTVESACKAGFEEHPKAAMTAIKIILGYSAEYENYKNLYTTWENYQKYYEERKEALEEALDDLDEDDDGDDIEEELEELEEEYEEYKELYEDMETAIDKFKEVLDFVKPVLEKDINQFMVSAIFYINDIIKYAEKLHKLAKDGNSCLDDVIKALDKLEESGQNWQSAIDDLSEGEVKTSMQADYENKAKELDEDAIHALQNRLSNGMAYAQMILDAAKAVKVITYSLHIGLNSTYAVSMKNCFEGTTYGTETLLYEDASYQNFSVSDLVESANNTNLLEDETYTIYFINPAKANEKKGRIPRMDLSDYASRMENEISAKSDDFFKYLERVCPKREEDEDDSDEAKKEKDELFKKAENINLSPDENLPSLESASESEGAPDFENTAAGSDDDKVSENTKNNTKESADFMSGVAELLRSGRDKLYLSEYATQMFSYYTVEKSEQNRDKETLSGYAFTSDHNVMYKAEVEYILWGNPSGNTDVQYTLTTIFGIRFLLNSLYAFTGDPEIRQVSLALATSIAGWTGFGVPLVQSVITIGFALAETALDIQELKEGKSVPIYKAKSSWQIKPSGISKGAISAAIHAAGSTAKNYIYEKLDTLTEETKEEFKTELSQFSDDTVDNLVSAAQAAVLNPVQERLIGLVNVVTESKKEIEDKIKESIIEVRKTVSGEPASIARELKLKAIDVFENQLLAGVIDEIASVQNEKGLTSAQITEKIYNKVEECRKKLDNALRSRANELVNTACGEVSTVLDSANEELQKKTSEAFDNLLAKIDGGISSADLSGINVDGGKSRTSGAAALTMNYKEYLWLFIAVKSVQSEEDMLKRIGTLIETNLAKSNTKPSEKFKIDSAYTFIELDAKADLKTTFFSMPVPLQGGGSVTLGNDKYNIGYRSVLGY